MKPLIERGYLYIAQPPLYKAKIGKKEQYLKDDKAFKQFLYDWAREQTRLLIDGKEVPTEQWHTLLDDLIVYEEQLHHAGITFRLTYTNCHRLVIHMDKNLWQPQDGNEKLIEILKNEFSDHEIFLQEPEAVSQDDDNSELMEQEGKKSHVVFKLLNTEWQVALDFFHSEELHKLIEQAKRLTFVQENDWLLKIVDKERNIADRGILQLIRRISDISKPYMRIQRYKGLGEMNPDQLWETSMDSKTRTLLQVKIEDAVAADAWFNTLMGDDVSGRKQFIKEFGHFVKNLDV